GEERGLHRRRRRAGVGVSRQPVCTRPRRAPGRSSDMTAVRALSAEVLVASGGVVRLAAADLVAIRERAIHSPRKRARLCAHPGPADPLHGMLTCLARGPSARPHRHAGKSESFHIIEGELDVVLFHDDGTIREVIRMGPYPSGRAFFYRLMEPCFHTVLV